MKLRHLLWISLCVVTVSGCSQRQQAASAPAKTPQSANVEITQFLPINTSQQLLPLKTGQKMSEIVGFDMPERAITEFFGTVKGRFNNSHTIEDATLLTHFYALPNGKDVKDGEKRQLYSLFLDLYVFTGKDASVLRRSQHIALDNFPCLYGNWAHDSDSIYRVDLMWVDGKNYQIPLLKIGMSGTVISGVVGCDGLVIFPQGFGNKAVLQDFENYSQRDEDLAVFFDSKDRNGLLSIRQQTTEYESDYDKMKTTAKRLPSKYFDWNGKRFIAR